MMLFIRGYLFKIYVQEDFCSSDYVTMIEGDEEESIKCLLIMFTFNIFTVKPTFLN